jgi:hypothetical protein
LNHLGGFAAIAESAAMGAYPGAIGVASLAW